MIAPTAASATRPGEATPNPPPRGSFGPFEFVLALVVLLLSLDFTRRHIAENLIHPPGSLAKLCEGVGELPYQYRALVPWTVAGLARIVRPISWTDPRMAIATVFEAASVFLLYYALRALLAGFTGSKPAATGAALGLFFLLPFQYVLPRNWAFWYPSDLPSVLFFTLGLLLLHRGRWSLYYLLFALATFNRETTVFLTLVHVFTSFGRMRPSRLVLHVLAQAAIWIAVKLVLQAAYGDNLGVGAFYKEAWIDNLLMLSEPANYLVLAGNFAYLWIPLAALGWMIEDVFARRALLVMIPYFAVTFTMAVFDELRIYGEMIPIVMLGLVGLLRSLSSPRLA